mmetsp:Transcript_5120/g.9846  ORF Transcript_5120/g.9846 Transcript_5120/m.9846 type:complete len:166 (+) Transcript_5120:2149-2646(+)
MVACFSSSYYPTIRYYDCVVLYCRGALQSVLILREYKECYDALVDALERGGSLGDCIYAIENAAREHNKVPLRIPLGYISEEGNNEIWNKVVPNKKQPTTVGSDNDNGTIDGAVLQQAAVAEKEAPASTVEKTTIDAEQSLETLRAYKETIENKLKDIDEKLEGL